MKLLMSCLETERVSSYYRVRSIVLNAKSFHSLYFPKVTKCNPIAECELAQYMIDCITEPTRSNKILNIGGPDDPITMKMQGEKIFELVGRTPEYVTAPIWLFDVIINTLQFGADLFNSQQLEDAAETGRIGKYYAVEDMLTTDPTEKYGTISLFDHYQRLIAEGRPDVDPCKYNTFVLLYCTAWHPSSLSLSSHTLSFYSTDASDALITRKQVANLMKVFT